METNWFNTHLIDVELVEVEEEEGWDKGEGELVEADDDEEERDWLIEGSSEHNPIRKKSQKWHDASYFPKL